MATANELFAQVWKHLEAGDQPAAELLCRQILALDPLYVKAHICLGITHFHRRQFKEAEASFRQALAIQPRNGFAFHNLAGVLILDNRSDEAPEPCRKALELMPDFAEAWNNWAIICLELGQLDEAKAGFDRTLQLRPDFADAHVSRSRLRLLQGDFVQGWPEYEWRRRRATAAKPNLREPLWDGSPLGGKTILVFAEQGFGDTFQFIRYLELVKRRGGRVIFESPKSLVPILTGVQGIDHLVADGTPLPPFDVQAPLLSLPGILQTNLATIPAKVPYLRADPALVEHWRRKLEPINGFKIGIVWQGNPASLRDCQRSFALAEFAGLSRLPGVRLISLQKGCQLSAINYQPEAGRPAVHDLGSGLDETAGAFMDTAAVIVNLDLVISCDTSIAHLAGALGTPVWVPLCWVPDWRWLMGRADSPWYPTMRLFRQQVRGQWSDVFERMAQEIRAQWGILGHAGIL